MQLSQSQTGAAGLIARAVPERSALSHDGTATALSTSLPPNVLALHGKPGDRMITQQRIPSPLACSDRLSCDRMLWRGAHTRGHRPNYTSTTDPRTRPGSRRGRAARRASCYARLFDCRDRHVASLRPNSDGANRTLPLPLVRFAASTPATTSWAVNDRDLCGDAASSTSQSAAKKLDFSRLSASSGGRGARSRQLGRPDD